MGFRAVKYNTETDFNSQQLAIVNFAKNNGANINEWGCIVGIDNTVLCVVDSRIENFDFSPLIVEDFSNDNLNYFPINGN